MNRLVIENIFTMAAIVAIVVGVYAFGGGGWGFLGLILMFNLNRRV